MVTLKEFAKNTISLRLFQKPKVEEFDHHALLLPSQEVTLSNVPLAGNWSSQ